MIEAELSRLLTERSIKHGTLVPVLLPPSRNAFYTDHENVFVKLTPADAKLEHGLLTHLAPHLPVPQVLCEPLSLHHRTTVGGVALAAPTALVMAFVEASVLPLTMEEVCSLTLQVAKTPRPLDPYSMGWASLEERALANFTRAEFSPAEADRWRSAFAITTALREKAAETQLAFSHGDLHLRNFMRTVSGEVLIIDWEWMGLWEREFDAAKLLQSLVCESQLPHHRLVGTGQQCLDLLLPSMDEALLDAHVRRCCLHTIAFMRRWGWDRHDAEGARLLWAVAEGGLARAALLSARS